MAPDAALGVIRGALVRVLAVREVELLLEREDERVGELLGREPPRDRGVVRGGCRKRLRCEADARLGRDAVRAHLADLAGKGFGAAIVDAVFDRDLETIGVVALDHRLSVGASGIGLGIARALVATAKVKPDSVTAIPDAPVGGPAACLAGSCSQATLQQIANAEKAMPVLHLDPDRVVAGKEEARRALAWARERISQGPILVASSSTPDEVAALQSRHGRDAAGHAIEQAMADIAEGLVKAGVRRLVVAGGETSGAVVDRLKIPGFLVGAEIAAGVPVLRAVGADSGEMLLALKSGNFGGPEFFSDALKLMR